MVTWQNCQASEKTHRVFFTFMNSTLILPLVISVSSPSNNILPDFTSNSIYSSCATPRPTRSKTSKSDAMVRSPLSTTSKT